MTHINTSKLITVILHISWGNYILQIVQQNMPRNIFNFFIKYLNNTLPTRKNLCKWSISQSSACSFCLQSETLQHVVSSCNWYLENGRYTWRHNSVLLFLANTFSSLNQISVYADLPSFVSPSLITGDSLRPDLLLLTGKKVLYILELTLGFETNIQEPVSILRYFKTCPLPIIKLFLSMSPWVLLALWAPPVIPFFLYSKI